MTLDPRALDLTGKVFGRLTVVRENGRHRGGVAWMCRCECGNTKTIVSASLTRPKERGGVRSCGCLCRDAQVIDESGKRFERWTVQCRDMSKRGAHWVCLCDCGTTKTVSGAALRSGSSTSCGCKIRGSVRSKRPEYGIWHAMLTRCENPKHQSYRRYGGRGIRVCQRWHDLEVFISDMGPRPSSKHSLDRIDPNGDYEPGNVQWATPQQQTNNRALSEGRVIRVLDSVAALVAEDGLDAKEAVNMIREALLGRVRQ